MLKLKGRLHIGRISTSEGDDYMRIELRDERAGVVVAYASASMEQFMRALTAGEVDCELEVNDSGTVGKVREHKELRVPFPRKGDSRVSAEEARQAVAAFEQDGWRGDDHDMENHHRRAGDAARVRFTRWVDPPEAP